MTKHAIIIAAGRGSRLGPLGSQLSKAMITVGQQPMFAQQVRILRDAGVERVCIVVAPANRLQVSEARTCAYSSVDQSVEITVQEHGHAPGDAVLAAIEHWWNVESTYVLMADTLLEEIPAYALDTSWAAVTDVPADQVLNRNWCVQERNRRWAERPACDGDKVMVGLMHFTTLTGMYGVLKQRELLRGDLTPASMLNAAGATPVYIEPDQWQDVGDLDALARARATRYISREANTLRLDKDGIVWKSSDTQAFKDERVYLRTIPGCMEPLFPRVWFTPSAYGTEHIDQPTLAELFLYWPAARGTWPSILTRLCERVNTNMWDYARDVDLHQDQWEMYAEKTAARLRTWDHPIMEHDQLIINGKQHVAGLKLVQELTNDLGHPIPAFIHGDLNFTNILWSLSTGQPKLLDPRGRFGDTQGNIGDVRYDLAKLWYSYAGGFPAIVHGLYQLRGGKRGVGYQFNLMPKRANDWEGEHAALDEILGGYAPIEEIKRIGILAMLSAPPLHQGEEALALYLRGVQLAKEFLG